MPSLVARTKAMKIGNPLSENTSVGATISREHAEKVLAYIEKAKQEVCSYLCSQFFYEAKLMTLSFVIAVIS